MKAGLRFENFPWVLRQATVLLLGWRNRNTRFGAEYRKWQELLAATSDLGDRARHDWQRTQLLELMLRVGAGTPHYADVLPHLASLREMSELRDVLNAIPLLDKTSIRANPERFRNAGVKQVSASSTSGSTGAPMQFGHDRDSIQRRFAFLHDHLRIAGVSVSDPSLRLSGRVLCEVGRNHVRPWLFNRAENQLFLSSYHLDDAHADVIWKKLQRFRPRLIDGYPSAVLETLRLLDRHGHRLDALEAVITTAETLHPEVREQLEALSGVPVMDYYAASEGVPFIQQCRHGTYHVRWQSGIFEVRNDEGVALDGTGELVTTSFVQDRTPLIRYCTGDLVDGLSAGHERCACGLSSPTVRKVLGRVEDMVYTKDGRALGMFTYRTLKLVEGLGETQVIQHDYAQFEVNSVCPPGADAVQVADAVKASFERALGYPVTLRFNRVEQIAKGPSGKVRLVISKVARKASGT